MIKVHMSAVREGSGLLQPSKGRGDTAQARKKAQTFPVQLVICFKQTSQEQWRSCLLGNSEIKTALLVWFWGFFKFCSLHVLEPKGGATQIPNCAPH